MINKPFKDSDPLVRKVFDIYSKSYWFKTVFEDISLVIDLSELYGDLIQDLHLNIDRSHIDLVVFCVFIQLIESATIAVVAGTIGATGDIQRELDKMINGTFADDKEWINRIISKLEILGIPSIIPSWYELLDRSRTNRSGVDSVKMAFNISFEKYYGFRLFE